MGTFADELRNTQPPKKKPSKVEAFYKDYDKKKNDVYQSVLHRFKGECSEAARQGKRKVVSIPSRQGYGGLYSCGIRIGGLLDLEMRFHAKKMADEIKQMLDADLSKMGFTRYKIRVENKTVYAAYGANSYYYHFVIEASW